MVSKNRRNKNPKLQRIGKNNGQWKGDKATYISIHKWLPHWFGKPKFCEHCGTKTAKKYEWANISKEYKRDRTDWLRLCTSCHMKYDKSCKKRWDARRKNGTAYKLKPEQIKIIKSNKGKIAQKELAKT